VGEKYVERKIRFLFNQEWIACAPEDMKNENFYSFCIYEILKDRRRPMEEKPTLKHLKVKISQLHRKQFQSIFIDKHESTLFQGHNPSLSNLLQLRVRPFSWMITNVTEKDVITEATIREFCKTMLSSCVAGHRNLRLEWRDFVGTPITEEGLKAAVSKVACNNAPEREGICIEIFKVNWDSINGDMLATFNRMFLDVRIIEQQCIPKNDISTTPAEYRQITLLNTVYKIPARIRTTD